MSEMVENLTFLKFNFMLEDKALALLAQNNSTALIAPSIFFVYFKKVQFSFLMPEGVRRNVASCWEMKESFRKINNIGGVQCK